jgi:hypothetical protein
MLTHLLVALTVLAQSTAVKVDINTNKGGGGTMWYSTWWFWVLVGLFALIVIDGERHEHAALDGEVQHGAGRGPAGRQGGARRGRPGQQHCARVEAPGDDGPKPCAGRPGDPGEQEEPVDQGRQQRRHGHAEHAEEPGGHDAEAGVEGQHQPARAPERGRIARGAKGAAVVRHAMEQHHAAELEGQHGLGVLPAE